MIRLNSIASVPDGMQGLELLYFTTAFNKPRSNYAQFLEQTCSVRRVQAYNIGKAVFGILHVWVALYRLFTPRGPYCSCLSQPRVYINLAHHFQLLSEGKNGSCSPTWHMPVVPRDSQVPSLLGHYPQFMAPLGFTRIISTLIDVIATH